MRRLLVCLGLVFAPLASNAPNAPNAPNVPNGPNVPNAPNAPNGPHAPNALPPTIRAYLERVGFGSREYEALAAGRPAARIIETSEHDQLGVVAVIEVNAPPSRFVAANRNIVGFESGDGVLAIGTMSMPPVVSDVASLVLPHTDFSDLKSCRIGDCAMNLSSSAIARLRAGVNWSDVGAPTVARRFVQQMLVDYVEAYQRLGNGALVVYHDVQPPIPTGPRTTQLFVDAGLLSGLPPLGEYFTRYRQVPLPLGVEEVFYWQQLTFGMKPVTRVNHVLMAPVIVDDRRAFVLVSRMIYSSHYFRDGLEVRYMVPVDQSPDPKAFYLLCISRSHSESLTGFKGFLIGGAVRRYVRDWMGRYTAHVREMLESSH